MVILRMYFWAMLMLELISIGIALASHGKRIEFNGMTSIVVTLLWIPAFLIMWWFLYC